MVGLLDISPRGLTVDIDGEKVDVPGVSAEGIAYLIGHYPELVNLMSGGNSVNAETLAGMGSAIVGSIIAAGCGYPGNEDAEKMAARYSLDIQLDLLNAILKRTLPTGIGPFVEKLGNLTKQLNPAEETGVIKLRMRASPRPSKPLSENVDIQQEAFGV
jgi:hypothetical protein